MKKIYFLFVFLSLICISFQCDKKEIEYSYEGNITGRDYRKCACHTPKCGCCGDWVIEIKGQGFYFSLLPSDSGIELAENGKFPIEVKLNYIEDPASCGLAGNYILITDIERK